MWKEIDDKNRSKKIMNLTNTTHDNMLTIFTRRPRLSCICMLQDARRTSCWSSSSDHLSDFTTQCGLNTAMVTKLEEGSVTLHNRHMRAKHRLDILIRIDIVDQGNWMHESSKADAFFFGSILTLVLTRMALYLFF